jgi:hypothetical protein
MKSGRVHRWFGAGLTGALFAVMLAVSAGSVAAADPLVVPVPGQDAQSPVQVVASPGFIQNGTAQVPNGVTNLNGQYFYGGQFYYANPGYPVGTVPGNGQYYLVNGQYYDMFGNPVSGVPAGVIPVTIGGIPNYFYGNGVTAAGPIAGIGPNGTTVVYDVQGGTYDDYVIGNGKYCAADSSGNALKGTSCNP